MASCDCWAANNKRLPHQAACASLRGAPPSHLWLLLARLLMEVLRRPKTQGTLERGRDGSARPGGMWGGITQDKLDTQLYVLRFLLEDETALDRVMPVAEGNQSGRYQGDAMEVCEALGIALVEQAATLGDAKTPTVRLPLTEAEVEDAAELAYQSFEALRDSKREPERDAFKTALRSVVWAAERRQLKEWKLTRPAHDQLGKNAEHILQLCRRILRDAEPGRSMLMVAAARQLAEITLKDRGIEIDATLERSSPPPPSIFRVGMNPPRPRAPTPEPSGRPCAECGGSGLTISSDEQSDACVTCGGTGRDLRVACNHCGSYAPNCCALRGR